MNEERKKKSISCIIAVNDFSRSNCHQISRNNLVFEGKVSEKNNEGPSKMVLNKKRYKVLKVSFLAGYLSFFSSCDTFLFYTLINNV